MVRFVIWYEQAAWKTIFGFEFGAVIFLEWNFHLQLPWQKVVAFVTSNTVWCCQKKRILTIRPPLDITLENGIFAGKSVCFRIHKSFRKWHSPSQRVRFVPFHSRNNQSDWIKIAAIYNINEWKWFKVTFFHLVHEHECTHKPQLCRS